MNINVNLSAPIGALALLGTGGLFVLSAFVLIQSLFVGKRGRAKLSLLAILLIAGAYLTAILVFAFTSHEQVLARGEEKYFCEIDCHLAYSIANTSQSKTLGNPPTWTTAQGTFTVVTIKTRFDETTISPSRGDGLLYPNSRILTLLDDRGNIYSPSIEGQRALEASSGSTPMTTPLKPGGSYTTDVAFDLPAGVKATTLLINEGELLTRFVIGHENSPLHKKSRFQL